jgi:predicted tellurium resistance membrane protein TerC
MDWLIALVALTAMEIVLGIDNIVFISIVSARLPKYQQPLARRMGLGLALVTRLLLLFVLSYIVHNLTYPIFNLMSLGIPENWITSIGVPKQLLEYGGEGVAHLRDEYFAEANGVSWKDIILFTGGLFLVGKSVHEIHDAICRSEISIKSRSDTFAGVLIQITLLDVVFSLDSVITAVGMVNDLWVMATAIVLAVFVMLVFSEPVSHFVEKHPTLKMLALSFLILIGVMLVAEGVGAHVDKGYIYFAMFFALVVEFMNIRLRKKSDQALGSPA